MLTKFWETAGAKFAEQWMTRVLTPAFVFWAGGAVALRWHELRDDGWNVALGRLATELQALPVLGQGALVVALLLGLVASALLAEQLTVSATRMLEGYWPRWLGWLRRYLAERHADRRAADHERFSALSGLRWRRGLSLVEHEELVRLEAELDIPATPLRAFLDSLFGTNDEHHAATRRRRDELIAKQKDLGPEEAAEFDALEWRLRRIPAQRARVMPTRLGNVLRAAEQRPRERYGLDPVAIWPQFWLVLPKDTRDEMMKARAALDGGVRTWLWGLLFVVWTYWAWWALPLAAVAAVAAYYGPVMDAAWGYGELLEATFDVHRPELYRSLRWPLPDGTEHEVVCGRALTEYLWRGTAPAGMTYEA